MKNLISCNKQLKVLRSKLNLIDNQLVHLLETRLKIAEDIADEKDRLNMPATDLKRETEIIERLKQLTNNLILRDNINPIFQNIFEISKNLRKLKTETKVYFNKIGIIGLGLIGGSIYKALTLRNKNIKLYPVRRKENISDFIQKVDLIILATPINNILEIAKRINGLKNIIKEKIIVMDVASVKNKIAHEFERLTNDKIEFVATHPMSGSEKSGFIASTSTLFVNNPWIITPHKKNTIEGVDRVENLIKFLGANVMKMDANLHDQLTAKISHLVFMLSIYLYDYAQKSKEALKIAGSGFKTMTRLAHGNKLMHNQILSENKENIEKELKEFINFIKKSGSIN